MQRAEVLKPVRDRPVAARVYARYHLHLKDLEARGGDYALKRGHLQFCHLARSCERIGNVRSQAPKKSFNWISGFQLWEVLAAT